MSIYEIPGIVKYAWVLAAIPSNIINSFKKTGRAYSFNDFNLFTDEEFPPLYVIDHTLPDTQHFFNLPQKNMETNEYQQVLSDIQEIHTT